MEEWGKFDTQKIWGRWYLIFRSGKDGLVIAVIKRTRLKKQAVALAKTMNAILKESE